MAIYKNSIPILEYDDNKKSVIMPNRAGLYSFPKYAVFAFLGDEIEDETSGNSYKNGVLESFYKKRAKGKLWNIMF